MTLDSGGGKPEQSRVSCDRCGESGHIVNNCSTLDVVCFQLQQPGHDARDCQATKVEATANIMEVTHSTKEGRVCPLSRGESSAAEGFISGNATNRSYAWTETRNRGRL